MRGGHADRAVPDAACPLTANPVSYDAGRKLLHFEEGTPEE